MSARDEARAHTVLERNLALLLRHAYVPARPAPAFRAAVTQLARAEVRRVRAPARPSAPARAPRLVLLAAAALVLVLLPVWWVLQGGATEPRLVRDALGDGHVVASLDGGTDWIVLDGTESAPPLSTELLLVSPEEPPAGRLGERAVRVRLAAVAQLAPLDAAAMGRLEYGPGPVPPGAGSPLDRPLTAPPPEARVASAALDTTLHLGASTIARVSAPRLDVDGSARTRLLLDLRRGTATLPAGAGVLFDDDAPLAFDGRTGSLHVQRENGALRLVARDGDLTLRALDGADSAWLLAAGTSATWRDGVLAGATPQAQAPIGTDAGADGRVAVEDPPENEGPPGETPAALRVRVTDTATAEPVPVVTLALVPPRQRQGVLPTRTWTSTAADGLHAFPEPVDGRFAVVVHAEGYALWTGPLEEHAPDAPATLAVGLSRGGRVRGYVVDAATGNGLAGAVVTPRADTPAASVPWDLRTFAPWMPSAATSAADGGFTLPHVSVGAHVLHVAAEGHAPRFVDVLVAEGGTAVLEPIELGPAASIAGSVRGEDGAPAAGEQLVVSPFAAGGDGLEFFALAETDADGRYRIDGLPGGMQFVILAPRDAVDAPVVRPVQVRAGSTVTMDFERAPAGVTVTGVLRDADGAALGARNVALVRMSDEAPVTGDGFHASTTAASGAFRFDGVESGPYSFSVVAENGAIVVAEFLDVGTRSLELDLNLGAGEATGRVVRDLDGAPVAGATVVLLARSAELDEVEFVAEMQTDARGRWRIEGLKPASYSVLAYPAPVASEEGLLLGTAEGPRAELGAGDEPLDLGTLALPAGGTARLVVADAGGLARAGVHVRVLNSSDHYATPEPVVTTDPDGLVLLAGLAPGTYTAELLGDGDTPSSQTAFTITAGETTTVRLQAP